MIDRVRNRLNVPTPRQFVNDLLAQRAFEVGDAYALHRPVEVHLQLASGCNLDCFMCTEHLRPENERHGRGLRFLDREVVARLEREVFPSASRLHLGVGGEPMLAPDFLDIVERAHAQGLAVHLTTNGTRIATERVAEVLARCTTTIEISVDGATAATYERIRAGASFARLEQNVALLNRHRLMRREGARPRLTFCMVLMASNVHELPLMVELAARLSVDAVAAWPVIAVTDEGRADAFDPVAARRHLDAARERARTLGIALDLPFDRGVTEHDPINGRSEAVRHLDGVAKVASTRATPNPRLACHMPTIALYVLWNGLVYPCSNPSAHAGAALGDLRTESFADIWNGRAFRNLRAGLARGEAPEVCRNCPLLHPEPTARAVSFVEGVTGDLARFYGDRDLAPVNGTASAGLVEEAVASGLAARVQAELTALKADNSGLRARLTVLDFEHPQLLAHAATLEAEREHLVRHARNVERIFTRLHVRAVHRWLARVKDVFVRPPIRPEEPYVPPWVADGSRPPGQGILDLHADRSTKRDRSPGSRRDAD